MVYLLISRSFSWSIFELFRETSDNGDTTVRQQRRTLQSQLSKCDDDEVTKAIDGTNGINSVEVRPNLFKDTDLRFFVFPLH